MNNVEILIRASLTDTGVLPRTGVVSNSPDVIPYQTQVQDPIVFFIENYDKNVGQHLRATVANFIYVRGKNLANTLQQGDIYVYYSPDTQLNEPAKWIKNGLKNKDDRFYARVYAQSEGNIVVTGGPFLWIPPVPQAGESYSLISVIVPKGTKPSFEKEIDFEKYVQENNNIAWTKVVIETPPPPPIPDRRWKTTFAYAQGETEREMHFELKCKAVPKDSYVSFSSDNNTGPDTKIFLDKTKISDSNASYGIISQVPVGYKGNISFEFFYNDTPSADSAITFVAYYLEGSDTGPKKQVVVTSVKTTN
jgi:hypothetical protein